MRETLHRMTWACGLLQALVLSQALGATAPLSGASAPPTALGAYTFTAPQAYLFADAPFVLTHELKLGGALGSGFSGSLYWRLWADFDSYEAHPDLPDCIVMEPLSLLPVAAGGEGGRDVDTYAYGIERRAPRLGEGCTAEGVAFLYGDVGVVDAPALPGGRLSLHIPGEGAAGGSELGEDPWAQRWWAAGYRSGAQARWEVGGAALEVAYAIGPAHRARALPELLELSSLATSPLADLHR